MEAVERRCVTASASTHFEARFRHKDGSYRVLSWRSDAAAATSCTPPRATSPMRRPRRRGIARGARSSSRRASSNAPRELAQANETLRKSERRFRALIEHGSDSIALIDADNRILYLSPAVANVEGYQPEELLGRLGTEHTHPDDLPVIGEAVEKLLAQPGQADSRCIWRRRHKDGRWIWLEGVATNLLDDPSVGAIVTNYRDITERAGARSRGSASSCSASRCCRASRARSASARTCAASSRWWCARIEDELPVDFCCICLYDVGENRLTVSCVGARTEPIAASARA